MAGSILPFFPDDWTSSRTQYEVILLYIVSFYPWLTYFLLTRMWGGRTTETVICWIRKRANWLTTDKSDSGLACGQIHSSLLGLMARETREGWPLLTVETERDSKRTNHREICPALAALVNPVQNIIFLTVHFFTVSPHRPATWAGRRTGLPVSVSLTMA